ncbi:hypothetical protein SSX86_009233 [Deinandra increscens subsp. villosa]|uniref:RING-type domain-containing protein n=1 Tax=Deinandra increscens subsp. villosa TaxID=3103831 RepID=A0AAP0DGY5_9ASTR
MADHRLLEMEEDMAAVEVQEEEGLETIPELEDSSEDEDELIPSETTSPRVSSSIADSLADGSNVRNGKLASQENGSDDGGKEFIRGEIDVCSICFEAWTSGGDHRICCLPCGHIYGMSCIKRWLLRCPSSGKCPQCKSLCTLKDIRVLYASRLCLADKISPEATTTDFPYTKEGFSGFQKHLSSCMNALMQRMDALERRSEERDSRVRFLEQRYYELMGQVQENSR